MRRIDPTEDTRPNCSRRVTAERPLRHEGQWKRLPRYGSTRIRSVRRGFLGEFFRGQGRPVVFEESQSLSSCEAMFHVICYHVLKQRRKKRYGGDHILYSNVHQNYRIKKGGLAHMKTLQEKLTHAANVERKWIIVQFTLLKVWWMIPRCSTRCKVSR